MKVFPVYSRVRSLYRRFRGWSPDPGYIGGSLFVRRSDGLLVELGSTLEFEPCVVEGVFRDIGENAAADEIRAEIKRRSVGWWAEQGVAPPLVFDEITLVEIAEAVGAGERAALVARAKTHWVAQGITLPANTEAQWSEWFDDLDALDDLLCNRPSR